MRRERLDVTGSRGGGSGGEKGDLCFKSAAWLSVSSASRFADVEWDPAPPSWTCWGAGGGILHHPPCRAGAASHRLREGASWGAGWHGGLSLPGVLVWKCSRPSPMLSSILSSPLGWEVLPCVLWAGVGELCPVPCVGRELQPCVLSAGRSTIPPCWVRSIAPHDAQLVCVLVLEG